MSIRCMDSELYRIRRGAGAAAAGGTLAVLPVSTLIKILTVAPVQ